MDPETTTGSRRAKPSDVEHPKHKGPMGTVQKRLEVEEVIINVGNGQYTLDPWV